MGDFSMQLDVYYGWCTLRLRSSSEELEVTSHWLNDALTNLVDAMTMLANGTPSISVAWPREIGGGHFVDIAADGQGGVSIVVHERGGNGPEIDQVYSAERGPARFRCHVPFADVLTSFVTALRVLRVRSVDRTGFMPDWGRTFPVAAYGELETIAVRRYGYKPVPTADIPVDESPDEPRRGRAARQ